MDIRLARVDDRLIHGQITTVWSKRTNVSRIIVIDDKVSQDKLRVALLEQAAPPGITVHVLSVERFLKIYANPKYATDRVLILFENIATADEVIRKGVDIKELNIGGVSYNNSRTSISEAVSLTQDEADKLIGLKEMGVELDSRVVASDSREDMIKLIKSKL